MHGFGSATTVHSIADESGRLDRPLNAFYVGDHDGSGMYMSEEDLPRRLERYGGNVRLRRIALTTEECMTGDLPSFPSDEMKLRSYAGTTSFPKGRLAWNSPSVIWKHFEKKLPTKKSEPKASPTIGLTKAEEAEVVEDAQIRALQARGAKIASLRETASENHLLIDKLNAEIIKLRAVIGVLLRRLGYEVSDLPTDEEIVKATSSAEYFTHLPHDMMNLGAPSPETSHSNSIFREFFPGIPT